MKKVFLLLSILLVPSIVNGSTFCVDSDSGNDVFIPGITVDGFIDEGFIEAGVENAYDLYINKDSCIKTKNFYFVNERVCVDNRTDRKVSDCPENYVCVDSDMDIDKIESMKKNLRDLGIKKDDIEEIDWTGSAKCVPPKDHILDSNGDIIIYPERVGSEIFECYDSDGGNNPTTEGELFFQSNDPGYENPKNIPDACIDSEGQPSEEGPYIKEGICYTEFEGTNREITNGPGKEFEIKPFDCRNLGSEWICKTKDGKGSCVKDSKIGSIYDDILKRSESPKRDFVMKVEDFDVVRGPFDFLLSKEELFLQSYPSGEDFYLYKYPGKLKGGSKIESWMNKENYMFLNEESAFFLLDNYPEGTMFEHPVRYCAMGLEEITCLDANWWPVIDGNSWTNWGSPTFSSVRIDIIAKLPIIGPLGKWVWEKVFGKDEPEYNGGRLPGNSKPNLKNRNPLIKIDSKFEKIIEDVIISSPDNDSVRNLYALIINFHSENQTGYEQSFISMQNVYRSLISIGVSDDNIEYLEGGEERLIEPEVDGISDLDQIKKSLTAIKEKMSCDDRLIVFITSHGVKPSSGGGLGTRGKEIIQPEFILDHFPQECPEPTIYIIISSCYSGQYENLINNRKVRGYYSATGKDIPSYFGSGDRNPYIPGFSSDMKKYSEKYKSDIISTDDLMLLSHISALGKDNLWESPRAFIETNECKRNIIADVLLKESYCNEEILAINNAGFRGSKYPYFIHFDIIDQKKQECKEISDKLNSLVPLFCDPCRSNETLKIIDDIMEDLSKLEELDLLEPYRRRNLRLLPGDKEEKEANEKIMKPILEDLAKTIKQNLLGLKEDVIKNSKKCK